MQTRQHAAAVVPTEGQDLLLHVMGVVFVEAAFSPVVHLRHTVYSKCCGCVMVCRIAVHVHVVFCTVP